MGDIARRASLSRQTLYHHFRSKDELTYEAARHTFETSGENARAALADDRPLTDRLVDAPTAWHGPPTEVRMSRAARFWQGYEAPVIDRIMEMADAIEQSVVDLLAGALASDGAAGRRAPRAGSAIELATVLNATARGLRYSSRPISKQAYARLVRLAVIRLRPPAR